MSFDDLLKSLQADYLNSIPSKIETIRGQITNAGVSDLRESFHKLKGTGRTYGIPEISEMSAAIEQVCLQKSADDAIKACTLGLIVLQAVYDARFAKREYALAQDPNFQLIGKLLQG